MFSFIETKLFNRLVVDYVGDDDYQRLQKELIDDPVLRRIRDEVEDAQKGA